MVSLKFRNETEKIKSLMVGRSDLFIASLKVELSHVENRMKDHIDQHFKVVRKEIQADFATMSSHLQKQDDALSDVKALVSETLVVAIEQRSLHKIDHWNRNISCA